MSNRKILIVEDEEPILFALREYFSALGYEVTTAREWEEAEALLVTRRFDIVLTDLRLTGFGGAEGLEIIGFVRAQCPETRIILLTGYGSAEVQLEARRRGVDALLSKPTPLSNVAEIADRMLKIAS
jgi:DNA-binding NtrC family response regulator